MASSLAKVLSQHSADELRKMLDDARTTVQRSQFEVEVIEEALVVAKNSPGTPAAAPTPSHDRPSPDEARAKVLQIIMDIGRVPPKAIKDKLNDDRINVYNTLGQLVKEGKLTKENGTYGFPSTSANGMHPNGREAGTQLSGLPPL
jgi:hypothetical protein